MTGPIALPVQRSPRQTLHHVWAPKLRRIVMLTGQDQLHLWTILEAHPGVSQYCERPAGHLGTETTPTADFWVMREGIQTWLRLQDAQAKDSVVTTVGPSSESVELISRDELRRHRVWIDNWLSLLPYLTSTDVADRSLQAHVLEAAGHEATLSSPARPSSQPSIRDC